MNWKHITDIAGLIVLGALAIWGMWRWLKRTDEPKLLIFKWVLSAIVIWIMLKKVAPMIWTGTFGAVIGMHLVALCGLALAGIWRRNISGLFADRVGALFDGGRQEVEPAPVYSFAQTHRNRGRYREAISEIRKQLERFPNDFTGQLLLAEIQAQNLNDLQGAELTVQRLIAQEGHPPRSIAYALNSLADWHLKFAQDRELARQDLEKIIELFPDTELSALAAQRIAHLADTSHLLAPYDRQQVAVAPGIQDMGLLPPEQQLKAPDQDPVRQASDYVQHLAAHPLDTEAREKLAVIYADHFKRLDLAADQLDQLIAHPNQPPKRVVHWLNLLADLQIKHGCDYDNVRATLERIVNSFPKQAAAETASSRIAHLRLELKAHTQNRSVQLGTYEQDIGLKKRPAP